MTRLGEVEGVGEGEGVEVEVEVEDSGRDPVEYKKTCYKYTIGLEIFVEGNFRGFAISCIT